MGLLQVLEKPSAYTSQVNQDDLWKKVIADLFEDFLLFFLPEFHKEVDFSKSVEFLQQELFKEIIKDRKGRKMADQIAKVHLKNGKNSGCLCIRKYNPKMTRIFHFECFNTITGFSIDTKRKLSRLQCFPIKATKFKSIQRCVFWNRIVLYF